MKVLFYISTIKGGGAARVMINLANQFFYDKHEVIFVTNFKAEYEYKMAGGIKRLTLEKQESIPGFWRKNIGRVYHLRMILKNNQPDYVVSFMHENDVRAYVATRNIKTKLILSIRNDPATLYQNRKKFRIAQYIYSHANAVVFQTQNAKESFPHVKGKTAIIHNPVSEEFYTENLKPDRKNIITVGKFMPQKNHIMLINAFEKIKDYINENLIIYGEGYLRSHYEKIIEEKGLKERVLLPGYCTDIKNVLSKAKVFVLSSDYEGMPNALMEAMAVGLPVISTDCPCGGPGELLRESDCRILVEVGDKDTMGERILELINDDEYAEKVGKSVREKAAEFTSENIYRQWKSFMESV